MVIAHIKPAHQRQTCLPKPGDNLHMQGSRAELNTNGLTAAVFDAPATKGASIASNTCAELLADRLFSETSAGVSTRRVRLDFLPVHGILNHARLDYGQIVRLYDSAA